MRPRSLMTAYAEGSIISRELRDMLADSAASRRFERELLLLEGLAGMDHGGHAVEAEVQQSWVADDIYEEFHHGKD